MDRWKTKLARALPIARSLDRVCVCVSRQSSSIYSHCIVSLCCLSSAHGTFFFFSYSCWCGWVPHLRLLSLLLMRGNDFGSYARTLIVSHFPFYLLHKRTKNKTRRRSQRDICSCRADESKEKGTEGDGWQSAVKENEQTIPIFIFFTFISFVNLHSCRVQRQSRTAASSKTEEHEFLPRRSRHTETWKWNVQFLAMGRRWLRVRGLCVCGNTKTASNLFSLLFCILNHIDKS